jgi:hypothetical protein
VIRPLVSAAGSALLVALLSTSVAPAFAQTYPPPPGNPHAFEQWQAAWDNFEYDRRHTIVATVAGFAPYRLDVRRRDGAVQTIDLKNGTVIRPLGATPQPGQRVAAFGYWSQGTFVANSIVLRY